MATPDDLKDTSAPDKTDSAYYIVTVDDLTPGQDYKFQFAWIYPDKRAIAEEDWSATKTVTASTESVPNKPRFISSNMWTADGILFFSWDGLDYQGNPYKGIDRVEVFITDSNNTYGDGTRPIYSFKTAETHSLTPPTGTYTMFLKAVTALGNYSDPSDYQSETVVSTGNVIDDPTLPVGLTAEAVPFGLKVNWNGSYSGNQSFEGFKSINVYAMNSDLGSSTTTALDTARMVAVLSVNDTSNSSNIPLGSYVGYSQDTFLYYISVNDSNEFYSVNGIPTYTRINSVAIRPSKANYIDLESGVISIQNLVAGNGQFQSWLRAGTYNGARVEINGTSSNVTDPNYGTTVYPGLSIYNTGNVRTFYSDTLGDLTITGNIVGSSFSSPNGDISIQPNILNSGIDVITIGDGMLADFSGLLSFTSSEQGGITIGFGSTTISGGTTVGLPNHIQVDDGEIGDYNTSGPSVKLGSSTGSTFSGLRNIQPILSVLLSGSGIADNAAVGSTSGFTEGDVVLAY